MWDYAVASRWLTLDSVFAEDCIFCETRLHRFRPKKLKMAARVLIVQFSICPCCGWWTVYRVHQGDEPRTAGLAESYSGAIGCLKELDFSDMTLPLAELRKYLAAKREKVYEVAPRALEDIVASIYTEFGYRVRVTGQRVPGKEGDDGLDAIMETPEGMTGVQVRRYKKSMRIEAEQIRSLVGALVLQGLTRGIFVTTTNFRRGAVTTAKKFTQLGFPVELIDANRFFDALGIAQRRSADLTDEQVHSYVLKPGAHVGVGSQKEFVEGENLFNRTIALMSFMRDEFLETDVDGNVYPTSAW